MEVIGVDKPVTKAMCHAIRDAGVYGRASARFLDATRLPYVDDVVNLVVDETPGAVATDEVMRVLVPGGIYLTAQGDGWAETVKPEDAQTDDWTHYLYDAAGSGASKDRIAGTLV